MSIEQDWSLTQRRVADACSRVGRPSEGVTIVAVSKLQPNQKISEALRAGVRNFGENYVQELLPKIEEFGGEKLFWHFIGPLQSNKAKNICGKVQLIHSVDRLSLAQTISKNAVHEGLVQSVLVQVNVSGEQSKSGIPQGELRNLLGQICVLPGLSVEGLMTMPPLTNSAEKNRGHFKRLNELMAQAKGQGWPGGSKLKFLSMGTSQDFEVAIEEGATHVRIGTTIFGERHS